MDMKLEKKLTDIHTHMEQYTAEEFDLVLNHADEAGVKWMVTSGLDLQTSQAGVEIASVHEQVLAAAGIHPWIAADNFPDNFHDRIRSLAGKYEIVAIGEVGLDFIDNVFAGVTYHDNEQLRNAQEYAFRKQVVLACQLRLPLIIHARGAYSTVISILREEKAHRAGGVIHNFDADDKAAGELLDMGFYLSFGGVITYPEALELHETIRNIPLSSVLVETDSPYMPLYKQSAEKNEPANAAQVAIKLAHIKKIDTDELIDKVHSNFKTLLKIH